MSWHNEDDLLIGDDAVEAIRDGVKEIVASYREDCDRAPTLAEVFRTFETILKNLDDRLCSDLGDREIVTVKFRTRKRRKGGK